MKKILLIITIFLLGITTVYALDGNVTSISVKEKSSTIIVEEPSVTNNNIDAKVIFKNVGDYVIFTLGLDIDSNLYTIETVTDNNESEHIKTTYEVVEDKIEMKLEYKSALTTSMDLDDIEITINVKDKEGNTETLIVNPSTGDNIIKYVAILGISLLGLSSLILLRKKKTALGVILLIAIIPTVVIAKEKMNLNIEFVSNEIKVGYDVVFNGGDGVTGSTETKLCYFGEECALPANKFEKSGKVFGGWATEVDGEVVYLDEAGVSNLAPGGEYELFAVWNDYLCKRATILHTKTCVDHNEYDPFDGQWYDNACSEAGYTPTGSKGTSTITYGSLGTSGTLVSGDAFDCDVDNDGEYNSETERFYYITSNGDYSILQYYTNVTGGTTPTQNNYAYYEFGYENWHGPATAFQQLPTTIQWDHPRIVAPGTRHITTEDGSTSTFGGTIEDFTYTDKAARMITYQEVIAACSGGVIPSSMYGYLDNCNYLLENIGMYEDTSGTSGYWLETPKTNEISDIWHLDGSFRDINYYHTKHSQARGVRPVITVNTNDIEQ